MKSTIKFFLFKVLDFIIWFLSGKKELDLKNTDIYIILKKPLGLGDLVMLSPFMKLIEEKYNNKICIVSEYDKFIDFARVGWIKPHEVDMKDGLVISPTLALTSFKYIFQAKYFVGYFSSNKLVSNISNLAYKYEPKTEHYLQKTLPILDILQIKYQDEFEYPSLLTKKLNQRIEDYIIIAPYSNWLERQYPKKKYIELIEFLLKEYPYKIMILGSSNEDEIKFNKEIVDMCTNDTIIINLTGKSSILQMNYLIKNSKLFIGNDSGPANIAYLVAPKSLVFFGSVDYENRLPLNTHLKQNILALDERKSCEYFPCYDGYTKPNCTNSEKYSCLSGIDVNKQVLEKLLG